MAEVSGFPSLVHKLGHGSGDITAVAEQAASQIGIAAGPIYHDIVDRQVALHVKYNTGAVTTAACALWIRSMAMAMQETRKPIFIFAFYVTRIYVFRVFLMTLVYVWVTLIYLRLVVLMVSGCG